jgi:hypothetical protein
MYYNRIFDDIRELLIMLPEIIVGKIQGLVAVSSDCGFPYGYELGPKVLINQRWEIASLR